METNYRLTNPVLHYGILSLIFGAALLTLLSHTLFHIGHSHDYNLVLSRAQAVASTKRTNCSTPGKLYKVVIKNDHASPMTTDAKLCDRLMFTNRDNIVREIAFGPHEEHVPYDGVAAKILGGNQSFTITLDETGMYHFHDHFHDEASGYFNVRK